MNQILISEKLYVTPELKRKKKIYKFNFIFSIIMTIILFGYYVYGEYDRTTSDKSEEILASLEKNTEITVSADQSTQKQDEVLVVYLDDSKETKQEVNLNDLIEANRKAKIDPEVYTTDSGAKYTTVAVINIPKLDITYPVIYSQRASEQTLDELLKISVIKYWGPEPNKTGNLCIAGHNYHNKRFFSNVSKLENGDRIYITDTTNKTVEYIVYKKYIVDPTDLSCTSQLTNGNTDITLITCTMSGKQRTIVKARAVK